MLNLIAGSAVFGLCVVAAAKEFRGRRDGWIIFLELVLGLLLGLAVINL